MFIAKNEDVIVLANEREDILLEMLDRSFMSYTTIEETDINYILHNGQYVTQEEIDYQEKERIAKLTCTKRVFALMLQELGITYTMLKELIATNEQAQLEWDLCVELERQNPLLDVMAMQLGITSEQLDGLFRYANGEITIEQFRELIPEPVVDNQEEVEEENQVITETESNEV